MIAQELALAAPGARRPARPGLHDARWRRARTRCRPRPSSSSQRVAASLRELLARTRSRPRSRRSSSSGSWPTARRRRRATTRGRPRRPPARLRRVRPPRRPRRADARAPRRRRHRRRRPQRGRSSPSCCPDARVSMYDGLGHLFFWNEPERFARRGDGVPVVTLRSTLDPRPRADDAGTRGDRLRRPRAHVRRARRPLGAARGGLRRGRARDRRPRRDAHGHEPEHVVVFFACAKAGSCSCR